MYKVYFDKRVIIFYAQDDEIIHKNEQIIFCKNKKSFDNAYKVFLNDFSISQLNIKSKKPKKLFNYLKDKYKIIRAAGGLVTNSKNELLIIKRNNVWDLPKGKIEADETKKQAAIREVEEECGITGLQIEQKITKTYHTYQFQNQNIFKTTHWYRMKYSGVEKPTPQFEEGISEAEWITKEEIDMVLESTHNSLKPVFGALM